MLRKLLRVTVYGLVLLAACLTILANHRAGGTSAEDGPIPIDRPERDANR